MSTDLTAVPLFVCSSCVMLRDVTDSIFSFPVSFLSPVSFLISLHLLGTLWNLSSYEPLKMVIINHGLQTMTNEVIIPHSGWEHEPNEDSKPRDAEWTTVFKNTSGCLRYAGLIDSIFPIIVSCPRTMSMNPLIGLSVFASFCKILWHITCSLY